MNVIYETVTSSGQFTLCAEIEGFEHNCTIDGYLALGLTVDQVRDLAEFGIKEAYDRFLSEQI